MRLELTVFNITKAINGCFTIGFTIRLINILKTSLTAFVNLTVPARSSKRPDISDIEAFTDFIYNKWQKLAKRAQLKDWSERRYGKLKTNTYPRNLL